MCQVWLKLASWSWQIDFLKSISYFHSHNFPSLEEGRTLLLLPPLLSNLTPLYQRTPSAESDQNWPSGSRKECEKFYRQRGDRQVIRKTTSDQSSSLELQKKS